jgi:hypothetical protein
MVQSKKINRKQTSKRIASLAGHVLRDSKKSKEEKELAASDLTQARPKKKKHK